MDKPKILIVTEVFYPEEFLINDLALSLQEKDFEVSVLTLSPSYPAGKVFKGYKNRLFSKDSYKGINIYRIRTVTGYRESKYKKLLRYINFMFIGSIVSILIGRKFNYIFGYNLGSLTDMLPAVIIRKLYKKPLILWVQDIWPDSVYAYGIKKNKSISYLLNIFVAFIFKNVSSIGVSSKGFEPKILKYLNNNIKIHYLPNWSFDLDMDIKAAKLSLVKKVHFTFAGNIGRVQNLENIINAFSLMDEEYQLKAQLNIIGDGSNLDNIKKLSNKNPHIVFHGRQNVTNMPKFFKASDFLIISLLDKPLFSATVPGKTQTYIAAKKPIIAIINGETADIIIDNNLGLHADPSDIGMISNVFQQCVEMPTNKKEEFIVNSQKLLDTTFNKKLIVKQFVQSILEL